MNSFALYLMGKKGLSCLEAILESSAANLKYVVYATDSAVENDYSEEIKNTCLRNNIAIVHRTEFDKNKLEEADYYIAISWRWLINCDLSKLIVMHDSLLPKYRGFNPLVSALINGDDEIGVTAILANEEFDRGDIISFKSAKIEYPITIASAIEIISQCYQELLLDIVSNINSSSLIGKKQNEEEASYSLWRDEEDYFLNWSLDAPTIERTVDALGFPYGGARTRMDNHTIIIKEAKALDDVTIVNRENGKFLFMEKGCPVVVCGEGLLKIEKATYLETNELVEFNKFRTRLK